MELLIPPGEGLLRLLSIPSTHDKARLTRCAQRRAPAMMCSSCLTVTPGPNTLRKSSSSAAQKPWHSVAAAQIGQWFSMNKRLPSLPGGFDGFIRTGEGLATQRIGETSTLRVIDAILTGTHEPGTSHHDLLGAFIDCATLHQLDLEAASHNYRTHESGDSVFIEKRAEEDDVRMRARSVKSPDIGLSVAGCRFLPL